MEHPGHVATCTEFLAVLDVMLQKHHDRLLQCLQPRGTDDCPSVAGEQNFSFPPKAEASAGRMTASVPADFSATGQVGFEIPRAALGWGASSAGFADVGNADPEGERASPSGRSRGEKERPRTDDVFAEGAMEESPGLDSKAKFSPEDAMEKSTGLDAKVKLSHEVRSPHFTSYSQHLESVRMASLHRGTIVSKIRRTAMRASIPYSERSRPLCSAVTGLVASNHFEVAMSIFILSNALFCGVEVEYMAQSKAAEPPQTLEQISLFFTIGFAMELVLRIVGEGRRFLRAPNCKWNMFDCLIVSTGVLENFLGGLQVSGLRIIRMARIVRVLRIARVMRHFRSLRILIYAVSSTIRSLFWMMSILMIALYSFGLLFTQAVTQHQVFPDGLVIPGLEDAFGTLGRSMFTLFKAISGGVDWQEPVALLGRLHPLWVAIYLVYFMLTYFALLNVVTGVFCHTAIESASHDQDMAAQAQMAAKEEYILMLRRLFKRINMNHTGTITLQELEGALRDDKVSSYFEAIDLSSDEAFSLFKLLDEDGSHVLDIDAFVTGCLKLRGQAKNVQIAMMMHETRWKMQKLLKSVRCIEAQMQGLTKASPPQ